MKIKMMAYSQAHATNPLASQGIGLSQNSADRKHEQTRSVPRHRPHADWF